MLDVEYNFTHVLATREISERLFKLIAFENVGLEWLDDSAGEVVCDEIVNLTGTREI